MPDLNNDGHWGRPNKFNSVVRQHLEYLLEKGPSERASLSGESG